MPTLTPHPPNFGPRHSAAYVCSPNVCSAAVQALDGSTGGPSRRVSVDRSFILVKAMLVAPNEDLTAHANILNRPTIENPDGYHRLVGGSVELGETHRDAIVREVGEELGATIHDLAFLATVENIFRIDDVLGHEVVFLYSGRLDPSPAVIDATLTESDGTIVPVTWRPFDGAGESLAFVPNCGAPVDPWPR